jgi:hypothetical protein
MLAGGMTGQDWDCHEEGGGLVIDGYHGVATDLAIPAAIDGRPVTVIGEYNAKVPGTKFTDKFLSGKRVPGTV